MSERFFDLLPAMYRIADEPNGDVLRGLMAVLEAEYNRLEGDVAQLYNNWFIETCEEWVVPYIGELLGLKGITSSETASMRAFVGNTIAYRRRKGTPQVLEEIGRDLLNCPVRVQEFFALLAHTQQVNHLRLDRHATTNIRDVDVSRLVGSAFDSSMHLLDVRLPGHGRGSFNLPNIGLSVWRLRSYQVEQGTPSAIAGQPGCFQFDPFGRDLPLYNRPRTEFNAFDQTSESDVPAPLERHPLDVELRTPLDEDTDGVYFGLQPVCAIFVSGQNAPVTRDKICISDLSVLRRPTGGTLVSIDPELGRFSVAASVKGKVSVGYNYGSPGDLGGGPYYRPTAPEDPDELQTFLVPSDSIATIADALTAASDAGSKKFQIVIDSDGTFTDALKLTGDRIIFTAASGRRPCILADITADSADVTLAGLWINGQVKLSPKVVKLSINHCTILNGEKVAVTGAKTNSLLDATIASVSLGPISIFGSSQSLTIRNSIIHGFDGDAICGPAGGSAPPLVLDCCTVFGSIKTRQADIVSESIITETLTCDRTQTGCVRFTWLHPDSRAPRRFRCQPDLAVDALKTGRRVRPERAKQEAFRSTRPRFQSVRPGNPAYAQLGLGCPIEVRNGAEDEGEMGAWHQLHEQERFGNLAAAIGEYVRFDLELGAIERT